MRRLFLFLLFFTIFFSSSIKLTSASTLFSDDFENGNTNSWISVRGPNLWQFNNNQYGAKISNGSTIIDTVAGTISTPSYIIEYDMRPISGEDKNIDFRWKNNEPTYEIHFNNTGGGMAMFGKPGNNPGWPKVVPYVFHNNQTSHIKLVLDNQHIQFFINDQKLFDEIDENYQFTTNEQMGLRMGTGASYPTEIWFDNVVVRSIDSPALDVPLLKQTSSPWGTLTYDSADIWSPLSQTIGDWGCAITSAAMVLNFHGYSKLPDGTTLDPGTLNTWLKNQTDGYVNGGLVNWLAIARLSKLAKEANGITNFDALEYYRVNGEQKDILRSDLNSDEPDILEEPGHFVVATGESGDTFLINDPYYNRLNLNDGYSNTFLSLNTYVPSNTDLSYIMLVTDPSITLTLKNPSNTTVGDQFIQQPITNPINGRRSGSSQRFLYLRKPATGNYNLLVSASSIKQYSIMIYEYDQDGNPLITTQTGVTGPQNTNTIQLNFNKDSSSNSSIQKTITPDTTLNDIALLRKLNLITSKTIADQLTAIIRNVKTDIQKNQNSIIPRRLTQFEALIRRVRGKDVKEPAFQILLYDINYLRTH